MVSRELSGPWDGEGPSWGSGEARHGAGSSVQAEGWSWVGLHLPELLSAFPSLSNK